MLICNFLTYTYFSFLNPMKNKVLQSQFVRLIKCLSFNDNKKIYFSILLFVHVFINLQLTGIINDYHYLN